MKLADKMKIIFCSVLPPIVLQEELFVSTPTWQNHFQPKHVTGSPWLSKFWLLWLHLHGEVMHSCSSVCTEKWCIRSHHTMGDGKEIFTTDFWLFLCALQQGCEKITKNGWNFRWQDFLPMRVWQQLTKNVTHNFRLRLSPTMFEFQNAVISINVCDTHKLKIQIFKRAGHSRLLTTNDKILCEPIISHHFPCFQLKHVSFHFSNTRKRWSIFLTGRNSNKTKFSSSGVNGTLRTVCHQSCEKLIPQSPFGYICKPGHCPSCQAHAWFLTACQQAENSCVWAQLSLKAWCSGNHLRHCHLSIRFSPWGHWWPPKTLTTLQLGHRSVALCPHVWSPTKRSFERIHWFLQQNWAGCHGGSFEMVRIHWKKKEMDSVGLRVETFHIEIDPHRFRGLCRCISRGLAMVWTLVA